jgi:hypothetical protein
MSNDMKQNRPEFPACWIYVSRLRSVSTTATAFARGLVNRSITALITAIIATLSSRRRCRSNGRTKKRATCCAYDSALRIMSKSLASQRTNPATDQSARPGTLILLTRCAAGN